MENIGDYRAKRNMPVENMDEMEWDEALESVSNEVELMNVSKYYGLKAEKIDFENNNVVYLLETPKGKMVLEGSSLYEPQEWIENLDTYGKLDDYIKPIDHNTDFWSDPGLVYHGTTEENWEIIKKRGLEPRYETRGLSNRNIGPSVFTSPQAEIAENSYEVVIEINAEQMKRNGYMPFVGREEPIEEAELKEAIASRLGIEDYYSEYEQGLDAETVIFYGKIPAKYLKRVK
jgi:hypothetical protein